MLSADVSFEAYIKLSSFSLQGFLSLDLGGKGQQKKIWVPL
jgi:hypothetical protein